MAMNKDAVRKAVLAATVNVGEKDVRQSLDESPTQDAEPDMYMLDLTVWRDIFLRYKGQEKNPSEVCVAFECYAKPDKEGERSYLELSLMRFKVLMMNAKQLTEALELLKEHAEDKEFKLEETVHFGECVW